MTSRQMTDVIQVLDVVLKDDWQKNIMKTKFHEDIFSFLDNEKLSKLPNDVVNQLLKKPCFSEPQRAYIREKRRKSLSSRAAKRHRDGEKEKVNEMQQQIDSLLGVKAQLKEQVEELLDEIKMYQDDGTIIELS
ncbi:hypothetical protein LOD99_2408 [Oopsacas minuta]|uniref:BZIP domain-containing protein n=1 Tax=Oopsacas minuta TaxID=111878 RepID=A0AAV7K342_9METZ|nr:hypothetical protein LOD99_2408 [Oopsacas minuta]